MKEEYFFVYMLRRTTVYTLYQGQHLSLSFKKNLLSIYSLLHLISHLCSSSPLSLCFLSKKYVCQTRFRMIGQGEQIISHTHSYTLSQRGKQTPGTHTPTPSQMHTVTMATPDEEMECCVCARMCVWLRASHLAIIECEGRMEERLECAYCLWLQYCIYKGVCVAFCLFEGRGKKKTRDRNKRANLPRFTYIKKLHMCNWGFLT